MMRGLLGWLLVATNLGQAAAFDAAGVREMDELLDKAINKKQPPGVVVWLEHGNQKQIWLKGDRAVAPAAEKMTEDTVFDAASLTKVLATMPAIMMLVESGRMSLDAPVQRYLPAFSGAGRERVLVRHLLAHTSGLKAGLRREPAWSGYEQGIQLALATLPDFPPDTVFRYSDINFILLGEIVRVLSGQRLDEFAANRIFKPLKMNSTAFNPPGEWMTRIAPTEKDENGLLLRGVVHDPTARHMGGVAGHAGVFTSAADMARFARMILNDGEIDGVRILKPETVQAMQATQTPITILERRGFGWDIDSIYGRPRGKHFPLGSFGHTGFTGASLWIDPFSKSFVIFLSSRLHPDGGASVRDLYEEVGTAAARCIDGFDFAHVDGALPARSPEAIPSVLNGIDVLQRDDFAALKGLRIGLITNQTGINAARVSTIDLLHEAPGIKLRALFSPEHGIRGLLDEKKINDAKDAKTGLPIYSLYGENRQPTAEQLAGVDALVFDIQDIGCRFYTYISTLRLCLEAAAKANKKFYILDRVNPIGGMAVEGPSVLDSESFTATHPIPIRHGMTVGELGRLLNTERRIGADLTVIKIEGWRREWTIDRTNLPWVNPSPNMRTPAAALLYPGIGLLEFSISVGRGTDTPFEVVGAPYADDRRLAFELNKLGLPGVRFLPIRFKPGASIFKDLECGGVRLDVMDRENLEPVRIGLTIAATMQHLYPRDFALDKVNTLLSHASILKAIRSGRSWAEISSIIEGELQMFQSRRSAALLY